MLQAARRSALALNLLPSLLDAAAAQLSARSAPSLHAVVDACFFIPFTDLNKFSFFTNTTTSRRCAPPTAMMPQPLQICSVAASVVERRTETRFRLVFSSKFGIACLGAPRCCISDQDGSGTGHAFSSGHLPVGWAAEAGQPGRARRPREAQGVYKHQILAAQGSQAAAGAHL